MSRFWKGLAAGWLIFGIFLAGLLGAEGLLHLLSAGKHTHPSAAPLASEIADSNHVSWFPFAYWRVKPFSGQFVNVDDRGLRRTWSSAAQSQVKPFKIFMFGGSTMWGFGNRDNGTIPSQLAKLLYQHHLDAEITNFGQIGYVSSQEVIALMRELQKNNVPDLAIFYDPGNDVYSAYENREAGVSLNEPNRAEEFNLLNSERQGDLFRDAFLAFVKSWKLYHVAERITRRSAVHPMTRSDYLTPDSADLLARHTVAVYAENEKIVKTLAKGYGFNVLIYLQPSILLKKTLTPEERRMEESVTPAERDFFLKAYENFQRFSDPRKNPEVHDISLIFQNEPKRCYTDGAHITDAANKTVAARMLKDILNLSSFSREASAGVTRFR